MFTLQIDTDNAAFEDDAGPEIARILRSLAQELERGRAIRHRDAGPIRDANGNTVGRFALTD